MDVTLAVGLTSARDCFHASDRVSGFVELSDRDVCVLVVSELRGVPLSDVGIPVAS